MSFSIGIVGLPNVGKSTLFKALTKKQVDISNYPFCTVDPNVGVVKVPDQRLNQIAKVIKPEKVIPTTIEFVDIAGLVKNAHKGEGLGNQFLSHIREVDAIIQVVRIFEDESVSHLTGSIDSKRDIEIVNLELALKDLETIEKRMSKVLKEDKGGDKEATEKLEILKKLKNVLEKGRLARESNLTPEEKEKISDQQLLTLKPTVYLFNGSLEAREKDLPSSLILNFKLEADLAELSPKEIKELELPSPKLDQLIKTCYHLLSLITFYTIVGGKETRAWTIKRETKVSQAAGVVHSDFEKRFIRAEVIDWQELVEAGSWAKAKEKGLIRTEGKEYPVKDGEVIEFKI
ncbi:MAG TPA: redox-regulated ATPase YchF [Candidatus Portnoybacteria bacterium]|nr:redox-regulated ATPase YchF [Candidatus Portnoybacteria bacterium]